MRFETSGTSRWAAGISPALGLGTTPRWLGTLAMRKPIKLWQFYLSQNHVGRAKVNTTDDLESQQ